MNHWTRNEPTEPGHYWMLSGGKANVVEVIERSGNLCVKYGTFMVGATYFGKAEWYGPLPVPTYQKKETILLRDRDRLESMIPDHDPLMDGVQTISGRTFRFNGIRNEVGVHVFTEVLPGCTLHI